VAGFVATEVVKQLLEKGYKVVGTVRKAQGRRTQTLKRLGEALPGTLQLVEADLLTPGSFDSAVQDCIYVFHTA
jgi:nucleoside-diphosphate-sugar epimerase